MLYTSVTDLSSFNLAKPIRNAIGASMVKPFSLLQNRQRSVSQCRVRSDVKSSKASPLWHPSRRFFGAPSRAFAALLVALGFKSSRHKLGYWRQIQQRAARSRGLARAQSLLIKPEAEHDTEVSQRLTENYNELQAAHNHTKPEHSIIAFRSLPEIVIAAHNSMVQTLHAAAAELMRSKTRGRHSTNAVGSSEETLEILQEEFMPASSYQNDPGSVLNDHGVSISVMLHIDEEQHFELKVDNLNSPNGGSDGWFSFNGTFKLFPTSKPDILGISLFASNETQAFVYDTRALEMGTALAFRCLTQVGGAVLKSISLQVDTVRNLVTVTPTAPVIRLLWWQPVQLRPSPGSVFIHAGNISQAAIA